MKLDEAIDKIKSEPNKKKFVQSIEVSMNFQNIDFTKPDNKINLEVLLPKGRGKDKHVALICNDELATKSKGAVDKIIMGDEIPKLGKNKKALKKLASGYDFFIAEASLMPVVGKAFGQVLAPRGKMPKPVPPAANIAPLAERLKNTVVIKTKGKNLPVLHAPIGTEEMTKEDLISNAKTVIKAVIDKLPQKEKSIKSMYVKTTMGEAIKVEEF